MSPVSRGQNCTLWLSQLRDVYEIEMKGRSNFVFVEFRLYLHLLEDWETSRVLALPKHETTSRQAE